MVILTIMLVVSVQLGMSTSTDSSIYWMSNPTMATETLLIAGAFDSPTTTQTSVQFCSNASGCQTATASVWSQSIQVQVPHGCGPPCHVSAPPSSGFGSNFAIVLNEPDIWWFTTSSPASTIGSDPTKTVTVRQGDTARFFGRSLGWSEDGFNCVLGNHSIAVDTTLMLSPSSGDSVTVKALRGNCYEVEFVVDFAVGRYIGDLTTIWGSSSKIQIEVLPKLPPTSPTNTHQLDVKRDYMGKIDLALTHAASIVSTDAAAIVELRLSSDDFFVSHPLVLPNRTAIIGVGWTSRVVVNISTPVSPVQCSKPELSDFYVTNCSVTHAYCFHDFANAHVTSLEACCDACRNNKLCNAFTYIGGMNPPLCEFRSCADPKRRCATSPSSPGPNNRTSAWINGRQPTPSIDTNTAILVSGDQNSLKSFALEILDANAETPAVWMQPTATRLLVANLNITLHQRNVSNALKVEGIGFEIVNNTMNQVGSCMWPPHGDTSPFMPSVTIYLHNSSQGVLRNNTIYWRCSAFDMDVSNWIVFEDNTIICTNDGVVPHGNSVSGYDWRAHPASHFWSIARNSMSRPSYTPGTEQNWIQRETITTDGSGQYGTALLEPAQTLTTTTVQLKWLEWSSAPIVGCVLMVLSGPGTGQSRAIVAVSPHHNGSVILDEPFDSWIATADAPKPSVIAVLSNFGTKAIVGNNFNWTEVVQWYGNTRLGVMADNSLHNCNVKPGGNIGMSSMGGVGECYHGSDPVFFTEFYGNTMHASDGIGLLDSSGSNGQSQCSAYRGPWVRWSVIRSNTLGGISEAAKNISAATGDAPNCAIIALHQRNSNMSLWTTDIIAEHNAFSCPPEGNATTTYAFEHCSHCHVGQGGSQK